MGPVIEALFETPVIVDSLPDAAALNAGLLSAIRARRASHPAGVTRSNQLGWHSDIDMLDWGGAAARALVEHVVGVADEHSIDIVSPDAPRFAWLPEMWANISPRGASNQFHCHAGAFWSAVYYVDDGYAGSSDRRLGGELIIEDPRMPMLLMEGPDLRFRPRPDSTIAEPEQLFRPASGRLLMFPGWLRHGVKPYLGDRERVSIAINLTAFRRPA